MQRVVTGKAGWQELRKVALESGVKTIFLICGDNTFSKSGVAELLDSEFGQFEIVRFSWFSANPTIEMVRDAVVLYNHSGAQWLMAVGGGSAIDIAKCVKALAVEPELAADDQIEATITAGKYPLLQVPLIAVPTTAGSGSEATHFAVVYVDDKKFSLAHKKLIPDYALLDASLTASMSPLQAATTGLDAWAQSIEAYWSVRATAESDRYALEAFKIIHGALQAAVGGDRKAQQQMLQGANLAGKAINVSQTTAAHAFSYAITGTYNLPHGHAVWMTLPSLIAYNYHISDDDCQHPAGSDEIRRRIEQLADLCGLIQAADLPEHCIKFAAEAGVKVIWHENGVETIDAIHDVLMQVNTQRLKNNPRLLVTEDFLHEWLVKIQGGTVRENQ